MTPISRDRKEHYTGASSEYTAAAWYLKQGYQVYFPCMQQGAVDFVVDIKGKLTRVQVKTATWNKSGNNRYLQVRTQLTNTYKNILPKDLYELFVVLAPDGRIWEIPSDVIESTNLSLHSNKKGVSKWEPYLVQQQIN